MRELSTKLDKQLSTSSRWTFALIFLLLFVVASSVASAACVGLFGTEAVASCQEELDKNSRNLEARLALAIALDKLNRKHEALQVLDQGLVIFGGDTASKSILEERRWILQQQPNTVSDATTKVSIIKCTTLTGTTALKACNAGLSQLPENTELLVGKGDALLSLSPPGVIAALGSYNEALAIDPTNKAVKRKLDDTELLRQQAVSNCMKDTGGAALTACKLGLLDGAFDEAAIRARRGDLLVSMNQDEDALGEYRLAFKLDPDNSAARHAIDRLMAAKEVPEPLPSLSSRSPVSPPPPPPPPSKPATPRAQKKPARPEPVVIFSNAPVASGITY